LSRAENAWIGEKRKCAGQRAVMGPRGITYNVKLILNPFPNHPPSAVPAGAETVQRIHYVFFMAVLITFARHNERR
jgi:hypothetical protein